MALKELPSKEGAPVIDSGDLLEFLESRGITVIGDTVMANADGTVSVDTLATTALTAAWAAYVPPVAVTLKTRKQQLTDAAAGLTTLVGIKDFIRDQLIPALPE